MADKLDFSDLGAKPAQTLDFSDIGAKPEGMDFSDLGAEQEQSKFLSTDATPRRKPTKLSEVERSWWGGVKNPHDNRFFDEKAQGFIKAIESPDGQRLVRGMENPAVAIFNAIPKVTEQQIQDALDIFSASGLSMASASGNPSFENLKIAEELRQSKSTKPGSTAKVIAGTRGALQTTTEALAEPESLAMMAVPPAGLVGRLVSLGFAADMLYHMPEQVTELKKATAEKDTAGQVEATANLILTGLFSGLAIKHGLTPSTPVIRDLAEHVATGKDAGPAAERLRYEINKARAGTGSPEFRSFFGGIDPELAGTTAAKVSEFARSMGMEYRPTVKESPVPEQNQPRAETRLTRTPPEPTQSQMEYGTGGELPQTLSVWTQPEQRLTRSPEQKPTQPRAAFAPTPGVRLVPVLESTTGRFFPGLTHADALAKTSPEYLEEAMTAQDNDAQHKFLNVDTGQVLTRAEAGKAVGYRGELQSEYLPKAYKEASLAEASMLSVMSPEERADYLSRKNPVNETAPQTPTVPKQAPGQVPEKEQAKDLPTDPERIPPVPETAQAPVPAQLPVGQVAVQDLSTVKAVDLNPFKTAVEVMYDPGIVKGSRKLEGVREAGPVPVIVAVNQPGQGQNRLLVQLPGPTPRTIWAAKISDLVQSGVLARAEQGYILDEPALWSSPFLVKATDARFKPYKLPGQKLDRSEGFASEDVELAASEQNPFFGAILSALNLAPSKLKAMAGAKSGNKVYAGKDAVKVAQQVREFFLRDLKQKLDKKRDSISDMSQDELEQIYLESRIRTAIRDNKQDFTPDEVSEAVSYLSQVGEVQRTDTPRVEVPLAEVQNRKDPETGVVPEGDDVGAAWDPARTDRVLGRIEDKNPKLYQSFSADPDNDRAWADIEQDLVKFLNGDKVGAEILAETIRAKRMEGWMAGQPKDGAEFEEHNWLTGISATGKDGILSLFQNRNIHLDPRIRRLGILFMERFPAKYFKDLTFSIDATGSAGGEFIPWLNAARIALDSNNPEIAVHELSHWLAKFLTGKERGLITAARAAELGHLRSETDAKEFLAWLESKGGSATSAEYVKWKTGRDIDPNSISSPQVPFRFATSTEMALRQPRPFGITPDRNGFIQKQSLLAKMKVQIPKEELEVLKPILDSLPDRVNAALLADRVQRDGPQLEVVKLDANKAQEEAEPISRQAEEFNTLRHTFYDVVDEPVRGAIDNYVREYLEDKESADTSSWFNEAVDRSGVNPGNDQRWFNTQLRRYAELSEIVGPRGWQTYETKSDQSDSATFNYQFVNPKPLKDMPGAVDILVRVPAREVPYETREGGRIDARTLKFQGGHFGGSDINVVGWVRGYIETLPGGDRVFHVFEVQSDWSQQVRDRAGTVMDTTPRSAQMQDPILAYYESVALKASIRHAKELGITKIAVSDSETAMITEGHDRQNRDVLLSGLTEKQALYTASINPGYHIEQVQKYDKVEYRVVKDAIKQEPGMRLHYDQTLPNILKKLTGSSPVTVNFGIHQNVIDRGAPPETAMEQQMEENESAGMSDAIAIGDYALRSNLLFGGKTSITARMFDTSGMDLDVPAQMFRSSLYSVVDKYYHLINDDEFFAHGMSETAAKQAPELASLYSKVKDILRRILDTIKEWLGRRPDLFESIWRKFERGEFVVEETGGMLFEKNNRTMARSLPPIKSREELKKYTDVDQGREEAALVRTLTYEQNHPLVAHVKPLFDILPDKVKAELPGISSRLDVLDDVIRGGVSSGDTPLKHYAVVVNALSMQEEAQKLGDEIEQIVGEIQKQNNKNDKASLAEIRAKQLEEMAQSSISSYKELVMSENRRAQAKGTDLGLSEAIKTLDGLRDSTESLKRAIEFIAEGVTLDELNNPALTTQQVVDLFKARIMELTGAPSWQQSVIPPGKDRPGVNNEQLRIAVRILQENQRLVQDLITHKELSDPDLARIMRSGEKEFDDHIAGFNHRSLRSFLKTFRSVTSAKDKARQVYLKHRLRLKDLIERVETKVEAEDFLHGQVLGSVQFRSAMEEASKRNFQSTRLVKDNDGINVLKRTYYNPLNLEESLDIVDGPGLEDYERNRENFDKVLDWFDAALNSDRLDPLDRQAIEVEEYRILDQEQNEAYSPRAGKRVDWWLNTPSSIFANFVGHSAQYAMGKIGGRAGIQVGASFQAKSEAIRRTIEVRHEQQPLLQKTILEAMRGHTMTQTRWVKEVAEPIIASYSSLGARQIKATDTTRYGHRVSGKDMESVRLMKKFEDSMVASARDMDLHTAKLHPIKIKEVISGREIRRDPQGSGTEMVMARRWNPYTMKMADSWNKLKNNRSVKDATADLAATIKTGPYFDDLVLSHIYSGQRYPDYDNPTRFKPAYREIYRRIMNGQSPANLNEVVDVVFRDQTGTDTALQLTSEEITREIVKEVDQFVSKILDEGSKDRAADTPGMKVRVESADNFMTKPRGKMIAPDSFYRYSVVDRDDIKWLVRSVQEVHEQIALDGLEKVKKMLEEYVSEWEDRARHPKAQKESTEEQMSGESWLNYRESRNMLNQVRRHIDKSSPEAFRTFVDEQFGTTGRRAWGILIQSLLQSSTVLKNNLLGMNLRQSQMYQQWMADGVWMGMPRWLLKMPSLAKNGIAMPIANIPAYLIQGQAYKKTLKKGVKVKIAGKEFLGEDALRLIIASPELANTVISQVKAVTLKRAINLQRAKDLGAAGRYGLVEQLKRYVGPMFTSGGEIENLDPTTSEKIHGGINSILGLFQESGGGILMPKAWAPRKLEEYLNFQAIEHANVLLEELTLNIKEALADRARIGITSPITDQELLGDHRAHHGDAMYMRKMFNRAGLNLDALIKHLERNPDAELLQHSEWNSFVLEVAKEVNMPAGDNRIVFKSGFARAMSSLMGYGIWYNERMAETLARNSQKKFDLSAVYRAMYFLGAIVAMGVFVGVPLQRLLKRLLNNEEDQTGHFDEDNTGWRNAGVLWEQTAPFWPIIGSVMSQLYDAKAGGGKLFNFLPVSVAAQALQSANEVAQTGDAFYPTIKLIRSWLPNTKIILNRIPATEGLMEVNSAGRILRSTAAGDVEVRTQKGGGNIRYSPVSTQVQMAVNELAKASPDYDAINQYRNDAVKVLVGRGAKKEDAQRRFDLSVLTRYPENTVFGRPLTDSERAGQRARMNTGQASKLSQVESAFDRYASTFGLRAPSQSRQSSTVRGTSAVRASLRLTRSGWRRRSNRLVRNRSLIRRRSRRLVRG